MKVKTLLTVNVRSDHGGLDFVVEIPSDSTSTPIAYSIWDYSADSYPERQRERFGYLSVNKVRKLAQDLQALVSYLDGINDENTS